MKIGDPYVREILNKAVSTSQDLESFIFETNNKLSQLSGRIDDIEDRVLKMEIPMNQCQDTIGDAFKEIDKIKEKLNINQPKI